MKVFKKFGHYLPVTIKQRLFNKGRGFTHYSQEGEDVLLSHIFAERPRGFYVDIGAYDPVFYSNSYALYEKGWNGIIIDPRPGTIKKFSKDRPRDKILEIGVSSAKGELVYYRFNEETVNTFDEIIMKHNLQRGYQLIEKKSVQVDTLTHILDLYAKNSAIDLLSLDVEGFEFNVLKALDWSKYNPKVICVEIFRKETAVSSNSLFKLANRDIWLDIEEVTRSEIYQFLVKQGYRFFAKTLNTDFFVSKSSEL